jgi:hypothetical protein
VAAQFVCKLLGSVALGASGLPKIRKGTLNGQADHYVLQAGR